MSEEMKTTRLQRTLGSMWLRIVLLLLGAVVLALIVDRFGYRCAQSDPDGLMAIPFAALYLLGVFLVTKGRFRSMATLSYFAVLVLLGLSLLVRYALLDVVSFDYEASLHPWLTAFHEAPGLSGLGVSIGDYNVPYRYMLFLLSKLLPEGLWIYGIKLFSVLFELLLSYYIMRLVSFTQKRFAVQCSAFFVTLTLPNVWCNAALFSQCDAVFAALGLGALYYGLLGRSRRCFLLMSLAFAFKLQSVFLMPMLLLLLLQRRIRLRDIWVFPATFAALIVPAVLAGRNVLDALLVYVHQAGSYPELTLQAPSVYSLFTLEKVDERLFGFAGVLFAGLVCCMLLVYFYRMHKRLDARGILDGAFLYALLIPLLLPHMHERYFFCADVLAVVYLYSHKERWFVPFTVLLVSFLCCYTESAYNAYPVSLGVMGIAMLAATAYTAYRLYTDISSPSRIEESGTAA